MKTSPGNCPRCSAPILVLRTPAGPGFSLNVGPRRWRATLAEEGATNVREGYTEDGEMVLFSNDVTLEGVKPGRTPGDLQETEAVLYIPHALVCANPAPAPQERVLVRDSPVECNAANCLGFDDVEGCGQVIIWVQTAAGNKRAPLDPTPHTGLLLDKAAKKAAKGDPRLVVGLDAWGTQRAILEGETGDLMGEGRQATVWVSHWATCPQKEALAEARARRAKR